MTQNAEKHTENQDTPVIKPSEHIADGQISKQQKKKPKKKKEKKILILGLIIIFNLALFSFFLFNYLKNKNEYNARKFHINQNIPKNIENINLPEKVFAKLETKPIASKETLTGEHNNNIKEVEPTASKQQNQVKDDKNLLPESSGALPPKNDITTLNTNTSANKNQKNNTNTEHKVLPKTNSAINEEKQSEKITIQATKETISNHNHSKIHRSKTAEKYGVYYNTNQQNTQSQPSQQSVYQTDLNVEDIPQKQPNHYQTDDIQDSSQNHNDAILMSFDVPKNQEPLPPSQLAEIKQQAEVINDQLRSQINAVRQRNQQKIEKEQQKIVKNSNPLDDW